MKLWISTHIVNDNDGSVEIDQYFFSLFSQLRDGFIQSDSQEIQTLVTTEQAGCGHLGMEDSRYAILPISK